MLQKRKVKTLSSFCSFSLLFILLCLIHSGLSKPIVQDAIVLLIQTCRAASLDMKAVYGALKMFGLQSRHAKVPPPRSLSDAQRHVCEKWLVQDRKRGLAKVLVDFESNYYQLTIATRAHQQVKHAAQALAFLATMSAMCDIN